MMLKRVESLVFFKLNQKLKKKPKKENHAMILKSSELLLFFSL